MQCKCLCEPLSNLPFFVIAFWIIVGVLMCILYRLTSQIALTEIITGFLINS